MILIVLLIACCVYLSLMLAKAKLALRYASEERVADEEITPNSVAILQAILSGDPALGKVLEGNLQSLSGQHFVWLCDKADTEAIRIADELMMRHPSVRVSRVLCEPCPADVNPKIFKLLLAVPYVTESRVIVLDDDTHLPALTAATLLEHLEEADIATGLPHYSNEGEMPSVLLAQFVNNNSAMTYLSSLSFRSPLSINGMCYAMRREKMEIFERIKYHLTDDLALAIAMLKEGGRVHQSARSQRIETGVSDLGHYFRMMHRWYLFAWLLIREQKASDRLLIVFLHGWHPMLLWMIFVVAVFFGSWITLGVLGGLLLCREAILGSLQKKIFRRNLSSPFLSVMSELLQPIHLLHALLDRRINWRGRIYRVYESDRFVCHE